MDLSLVYGCIDMTMGYGGRSKADTSGRQLPRASELQVREADLWPQCYEYVPQVVSLRRNAVWPEPPLTLGLTFARTLADVGTFLWHTGQFKDCEEAMQSAENLVNMQELTIRDTPEMMALLSDLYTITGIIADCIGVSRRAESLDHRDKALVLREKAFADIPRDQVTTNDEIRLWNTHCDRACAFMQRNRYEEAGEVFEKALERYQTWGREAEYPYKYSKYYHHMAFVLMARGASARAISYARKGADLVEMHAKGTLDTTVLIWKYDLASLLFNAGKVGESLALHEWILDHRRRLCGEGSQMTLESHESVAVIQHLRGNHYPAR